MNISQALEAVSERYVPGVVAYYGKLTPDPWQSAHDRLEELVFAEEDVKSFACEEFVKTCVGLIERFKREGSLNQRPSAQDAFAMGNEVHLRAWQSVRHQDCYRCNEKENISLEAFGPDALQVRVICGKCKTERQRNPTALGA